MMTVRENCFDAFDYCTIYDLGALVFNWAF